MANGQATDGYLVALLFTKIPSLYNCILFELQLQLHSHTVKVKGKIPDV